MSQNEPVGFLLGAKNRPLPLQPGDELTMGREPANNLFFEDAHCSRLHAMVYVETDGGVFLKDLGSTNGTFLNDERLAPDSSLRLSSGDRFRVGGRLLSFVGNSPDMAPGRAGIETADKLTNMKTLESGLVFKDGKVMTEKETHEDLPDAGLQTLPGGSAEPALAGSLEEESLAQIMQFLHSTTKSGELEVHGPSFAGLIAFDQGAAIFAHAAPQSGDAFKMDQAATLHGPEAVYAMVGLHEGSFRFKRVPSPLTREKNIQESTMTLIFEACRRLDES